MLSTGAMLLAGPQNLDRVPRQHHHAADAPRLPGEPGEPFQAGPSHPFRRPRHAAGEVVERPADADRDRDAKPLLEPVKPELLSGSSIGDDKDLCAVVVDPMHRLDVVRSIARTTVRRELEPPVLIAKGRCELGGDARGGAEEKQPRTPTSRNCRHN